MMRNKIILILIIEFYFICSKSFAQNFNLTGTIADSTDQPLPGAGVSVLQKADSALLSGTVTDLDGNFSVGNIPSGSYLIKISYIGFKDFFLVHDILQHDVSLGRIILKENSTTLKAVNVEGQIPAAQLRGDTTQYNADSYKTNRDANAEDLVTKMPGVILQDGKVQAQGEDVKKVLIDGKPYLGDDPSAALKNLPAELIDKIQVFDKKSDQSEFTGFDDGNTSKTINIVTRPQFRNGIFGRAIGGYGSDKRWKANASVNFFKDKRKFTIIGNANNVNEQNFAVDDLLGVIGTSGGSRQGSPRGNFGSRGGGGGGSGRFQGNDASTFLVDQKNGIATTRAGGINYSNSWKKVDLTASYFINNSDNNSISTTERNYFTGSTSGLIYNEAAQSFTTNTNHRANMRLEIKFDSLNSILFQPRLSIQDNDGTSFVDGSNTNQGILLSRAQSDFNSSLQGSTFSSPLLYRHSFNKKGRTVSTNLNATYNQNKGTNDLNSVTTYSVDSLSSDTLDQNSDLNFHGWNYSANVTYTEPLSQKSQVLISYNGNYNLNQSDKKTYAYSPADELYNTLDTSLSNKFKSNYTSHAPGLNYRYANEKINLMAGLSYQRSELKNQQEFPYDSKIDKSFSSILPSAMFQYRFTKTNNLRLFYRSSNNSPTVTQLQNVININNPLQVTSGNPDLKQDWQNNLNVRYSSVNGEKNTSFFVFTNGSFTGDYIATSTLIVPNDTVIAEGVALASGSQFSQPVNLDGYYSLRSFGTFSFPLKVIKCIISLNASGGYSRTPGLINNILNYSKNSSAGGGVSISSYISEKVDFSISTNALRSNIVNTTRSDANNNYTTVNSRFRIQINPWKGLVFQTDFTQQNNYGLSSSYNQNYLLWNGGIGYKFLKNRVAEIRMNVYDLLKQNNSITRNTSDTYYEDVQTNVLQRYFMLTFTYNMKFFKK